MMNILIIGAGNIGKGPIAYFSSLHHYPLTFISRNFKQLTDLQAHGGYTIHVLQQEQDRHKSAYDIREFSIYPLQHQTIYGTFTDNCILYICTYAEAYRDISRQIFPELKRMAAAKHRVQIILCSNNLEARKLFMNCFPDNQSIFSHIGLSQALVSVNAKPNKANPFDIDINLVNYSVEIDRNGLLIDPKIPEFHIVSNFSFRYYLKLYLVNSIYFCMALMGLAKNYTIIDECIDDQIIMEKAYSIRREIMQAMMHEFPADINELVSFIEKTQAKFSVKTKDSLARVTKNLPQKIQADERLIGPYKLCVKHNILCKELANILILPFTISSSLLDNARLKDFYTQQSSIKSFTRFYELDTQEIDYYLLFENIRR